MSDAASKPELILSATSLAGNAPARAFDEYSNAGGKINGERLRFVMENYLKYYAVGEGHTARAKRYDLQHFLAYLATKQANGAASPDTVTEAALDAVAVADWTLQATKDFIDYRISIHEAPATVGRRLATIKHFGRTLAERIPGYINPAREAKGPVTPPLRPHGLSTQDIELLRAAAEHAAEKESDSFLVMRNRFLLELLLATGLRADEVRLLILGQVSEDRQWLRNVKTKGKKFRSVYLETTIRPLLTQYLEAREAELGQRFSEYASLSQNEKNRFPVLISFYRANVSTPSTFGLSPKTVWRIIAGLGKGAQALATNKLPSLHPHTLRHTFAHGLLDTSKDLRLVAQALGHSDVRTTMRYTERTDEQIARAIEQKNGRSR